MNKIYLLLFFACSSLFIYAQQNDPDNWRYFKSMESVNCHAETATTVWLGTQNGLVLIDKNTLDQQVLTTGNSNLPSNTIESIQIDADGNNWIGTYDYILSMKSGDDWINLEVPKDENVLGGQDPLLFDFEIMQDGSFWVATNNGMWHYKDNSWEVFNSQTGNMPTGAFNNDLFWAVEEGADSQLFFAGHELMRKDGDFIENLSDTFPEIFFYDDAHMISNQGKITLTDNVFFIAAIENDDATITSFVNPGFPENSSYVVSTNNAGDVFVVFNNGEKYLLENNEWTNQNSGLADDMFFSSPGFAPTNKYFFIDEDGRDWASQYSELFLLEDNNVQDVLRLSDVLLYTNSYKRIAHTDDGTTYILDIINDLTASYHPQEGWNQVEVPDSMDGYNLSIYNLYADGNQLWFSCNVGLLKYDGNTWELLTNSNSNYPFLTGGQLSTPSNGVFYMSTGFGDVGYFDGQNWTVYTTANSDLINGQTKNALTTSNGDLWITRDHTIQFFDGNNWTNYNSQNSDLPEYIGLHNMVEAPNGDIWMAAGSQGVSHFDGTEWTNYSVNDGIYTAQQVGVDSTGNVWVASYQNVAVFDGVEWGFFDTDNSLLNDNVIHQLWAAPNGTIWMNGYEEGLSVYNKNGFESSTSVEDLYDNTFYIWPNPASQSIIIETNITQNTSYEIYQPDGRLQSKGMLNSNVLNVSELNNGMYFLLLKTATETKTAKLIIE